MCKLLISTKQHLLDSSEIPVQTFQTVEHSEYQFHRRSSTAEIPVTVKSHIKFVSFLTTYIFFFNLKNLKIFANFISSFFPRMLHNVDWNLPSFRHNLCFPYSGMLHSVDRKLSTFRHNLCFPTCGMLHSADWKLPKFRYNLCFLSSRVSLFLLLDLWRWGR